MQDQYDDEQADDFEVFDGVQISDEVLALQHQLPPSSSDRQQERFQQPRAHPLPPHNVYDNEEIGA